jgi:hypothetical protein
MSRTDVWYMVRRRAADAGIETAIGCHTFRATGITDYLTNGGRIALAVAEQPRRAAHRLDSARMPRSLDCVRRSPVASRAKELRLLL